MTAPEESDGSGSSEEQYHRDDGEPGFAIGAKAVVMVVALLVLGVLAAEVIKKLS